MRAIKKKKDLLCVSAQTRRDTLHESVLVEVYPPHGGGGAHRPPHALDIMSCLEENITGAAFVTSRFPVSISSGIPNPLLNELMMWVSH